MIKKLLLLLLILPLGLLAQDKKPPKKAKPKATVGSVIDKIAGKDNPADTIATIDMYKIVSLDRDTTYVDTSLTIAKEYAVNYLRRDLFGLLPFVNEGQTYNVMDYGLTRYNPFPEYGFKAKHFAYMEAQDIRYYNVATPFTDLFYRSVLQQGQIMDAFVTVNTSEQLNLSVGYKGVRSLGRYINQLASNGNFRMTGSYHTKDKRYIAKAHFTGQDFMNQENGGITTLSDFESGEDPYTNRERLNVYFRDATSFLKGNRYFIDHTFRLSKSNPNSIVLHHQFNYENKSFEFRQPTVSPRFGNAYATSIETKSRYNRLYNMLGALYSHQRFGDFEFYVEDFKYNYYYQSLILDSNGNIAVPNSLNDRINTYGGRYTYYKNKWKGSLLVSNSITKQSLSNIEASVRYSVRTDIELTAKFQKMNKLPDLNYRLYQSDYVYYNWSNDFANEKINNLEAEIRTPWLTLAGQYTILKDKLYFSNDFTDLDTTVGDTLLVSPKQYTSTINYMSLKASREFRFWKLALDNTILYQNVTQDANIVNVPSFITRNTLYFSDHFFTKALYLQTGVTFQYFTKYYANDYHPLLGEFYVQDKTKIGGYPLMDFFINAKIRTFRVFLKAEHFNSKFTSKPDYYSAPNYPYRDFTVRFGVIWDFFS